MTRAVEGFTGLEHALEPLSAVGGVEFVNDSKATNIEAALRAIESFDNGLVVILGGRYKGGDFGDLREALIRHDAQVVAIGEASPLIHKALDGQIRVHDAGRDMAKAVRLAFSLASPGETVLLAPACSSFDMFEDYAERGRVFKQEVMKLRQHWHVTDAQ
jgi:UDP-N-acetylmuramoylalanine--D-glutamate ligase